MNTVTYKFGDGTRVIQPIQKQAFTNEKGKSRSENDMNKLFNETAWDKGATSFTVDSEVDDSVKAVKEIHFTKDQKKQARKDYKDIKSENPKGHAKRLQQFKAELVDKFSNNKRRLRFNLVEIKA